MAPVLELELSPSRRAGPCFGLLGLLASAAVASSALLGEAPVQLIWLLPIGLLLVLAWRQATGWRWLRLDGPRVHARDARGRSISGVLCADPGRLPGLLVVPVATGSWRRRWLLVFSDGLSAPGFRRLARHLRRWGPAELLSR